MSESVQMVSSLDGWFFAPEGIWRVEDRLNTSDGGGKPCLFATPCGLINDNHQEIECFSKGAALSGGKRI